MDKYIDTTLKELQHIAPKQHHKGPSKHTPPNYGSNVQYITEDTSKPLPVERIRHIQKVIGKFLFMARALDNTLLHALNELACQVTKGTENTLAAANYILN